MSNRIPGDSWNGVVPAVILGFLFIGILVWLASQ